MTDEIIIKNLLNNQTIKKFFRASYYDEIYKTFGDFLEIYNGSSIEKRKIQNKLFIEYLKQLSNNHKNSLYERILISFLYKNDVNEIINYLLNQNIDLNYRFLDINGNRLSLQYLLAIKIDDSINMKLLLEKLKNSKSIFFRNGYYKIYNDLCRMNIIAGNLEEAFNVFNLERYKLFDIDNLSVDEISRWLLYDKKVSLKGYNINDIDLLSKVLLTIKNSNLDIRNKRIILINILKSHKIKLFNIDNLKIIEEILESENYSKFLEYLRKLELNQDIILFNVSKNSNDTIYYTNLDNILLPKINVKKV